MNYVIYRNIKRTARKWLFCALTSLPLGGLGWALTSCSDMLDTEGERQVFDPELNQKTDSMFYAYGILQAMQQVADQYVFQGEMRGDLVKTTEYTDSMLSRLADFSATTTNRYDSAYAYYRVINNCNYYIAHRDTSLYTGATNVVINEYAGVKAIRAWAYLQLARNYGKVPFFTEPLTKISQIEDNSYPELDLAGIVSRLAPDLERYTGFTTTNFGNVVFDVGSPNSSNSQKSVTSRLLMVPVDVILGDLYLENNQYGDAARHYITYLTQVATQNSSAYFSAYTTGRRGGRGVVDNDRPSDWDQSSNQGVSVANPWSSIFTANNPTADIITYIPMAVNRTVGTTTNLPLAFGYNYYATASDAQINGLYVDEVQIVPSDSYLALSDSTDYYYYPVATSGLARSEVKSVKLGDQRLVSILRQETKDDETKTWIRKYESANIVLYRTATVLLHLAEALNRLGMPDAAFAILKDGIGPQLLGDDASYYMSDATKQLLQTAYPLLSSTNISKFDSDNRDNPNRIGIHMHGAGMCRDYNGQDYVASPYRYAPVLEQKLREISNQFNYFSGHTEQVVDTLGETHSVFVWDGQLTKADSINAMEDILCDEYALEFAFEGTRWFDLMRLARHKNEAGLYDANFGGKWLARKLAYKHPLVNLEDKNNWYLPFR